MATTFRKSYSKRELADIAGYSSRRLFDIDAALPKDKKLFVPHETDKKQYDLAQFVRRWVAYNISTHTNEDSDLNAAKTRHEKIKIEKTELEVARLRGSLVDVQEVKRLWGDVAKAVEQNLMGLPKKLGPALVMIDSAEVISGMIDDEIRRILNDIANTPLPSYVLDDGDPESGDDP